MTILFDLDGTLLDTAQDFAYILNQMREAENLPSLSITQIRSTISFGVPGILNFGLDLKENHPHFMLKKEQFLNSYRKCLGDNTTFFPGIQDLLAQLEANNMAWGIVTNKNSEFTIPLLERFNLRHRAACVVSGNTTGNKKPHPEPLLYACNVMKCLPENCIFIGDAEVDVLAGKAAGMKTIAALFGYIKSIEEALLWQADHYIYHANEIWPYIKKSLL